MDTNVNDDAPGYARIVVPVDGSSLSETALPIAARIAKASHGRVDLVRVHVPIVSSVDAGFPLPDFDDEIRRAEQDHLAATSRRVGQEEGIPVEAKLLDEPVGRAINEYIEKVGATLLVMTTHGRTGLTRTWLGSTADWLVRFSPVPVLLMRPPEEGTPRALSLAHVLIALDGSERSCRIVPEAVRLGRLGGAKFTLLRVVTPIAHGLATFASGTLPPVRDEQRTLELMRGAKSYLDGIAETVRRDVPGVEVHTEVVANDRIAEAILEAARSEDADVVALSTRGRGASRLLVGSVADKVLRGHTGALFVVGPEAVRELESDDIVIEEESTTGSR